MDKFNFLDLFAGVGGFHLAMEELGGECVFASEINKFSIATYRENFGMDADFDICEVAAEAIPAHDVLCGGFPCQAFSKAGKQNGFDDTRGTLFFEIKRILAHHTPKFIVLENVRNLVSHDGGNTWRVISKNLKELGYIITETPIIMSPHQLGIPQLRERVYILGIHKSQTRLKRLSIAVPEAKKHATKAESILNGSAGLEFRITEYEEMVLSAWDEFMQGVDVKTIGFPIWSEEFGATYDYSNLPRWKQYFIAKNRALFIRNKSFLLSWLKRHRNLEQFVATHKKFEWQAGDTINSVWEGIIQFRPSGIRVKRPTEFPALVAIVHIPIIGWEKRRITPREAANLQSFPKNFKISSNTQQAYKQFGNAVNVGVVKFLANQLFELGKRSLP